MDATIINGTRIAEDIKAEVAVEVKYWLGMTLLHRRTST